MFDSFNLNDGFTHQKVDNRKAEGSPMYTSSFYSTTLVGKAGTSGTMDGTGTAATFNVPSATCIDETNRILYVSDLMANDMRKILLSNGAVTHIATCKLTDILC